MSDQKIDLDDGFLARGGELGALMRAKDWSKTALGPPEAWPRSLKTVVRIMLTSNQPIWVGWGHELLYLYNDPYKSIIGGKHPWALGEHAATVWREIWSDIGPLLETAMSGDGTFVESQLLIMERNGYPEETYYTFSYSPIPGDDGRPEGIICANSDETRRVIGERQLALLRDIAAGGGDAKTVQDAVRSCLGCMASNTRDITFALVMLRRPGDERLQVYGESAVLGAVGADGHLPAGADPWDALSVLDAGEAKVVALSSDRLWPSGSWNVPSSRAMVLPILPAIAGGHEGALVVGLNPYRLPDADYAGFLQLVARQVASAIASAEAFEAERLRAERLAELDRAKTTFFSNISHEFRTPLTLMQGPLADTLADPALPQHLRQGLELVENNAARLAKLVNALLEFSRIEAGRQRSAFRPTDLARLTTELASNFRSAMERAGLVFIVDCATLPEPVYVDPDQWERIVLNLLSNALKFTFTGSVSLRLRAADAEAVLEVRDTGVGVPEHEISRLFERFHRVEGTHGRTLEGSGIGLAVVQELVRLHGGHIAASSRIGQGTAFVVRVPFGHRHLPTEQVVFAATGPSAHSTAQVFVQEALRWVPGATPVEAAVLAGDGTALSERYRSTQGARVIVADDNPDLREYLGRLLRPYFDVEVVGDGEEALAAVRRKRPALVISDVMMPRLDGFGLLAALRGDRSLETLPVILLSARAGEEARVDGLRSGADDYLVKPFTSRELLARVTAIIELDRVRRAGEERLHLFLAGAQMFTWDVDVATTRVRMSSNAADIFGIPPATMAEGYAAIHPDDVADLRAAFEKAMRDGIPISGEFRVRRPDGHGTRWLLVRGRSVPDESGRPWSVTGLAFDITLRKEMELALHLSDRRKDEFLAMLAHELRNPLAPIRNAVELLAIAADKPAVRERALGILDRQVRQLGRLVDDLLDVSRVTSGRIRLDSQLVDVGATVRAAIEAVEILIRERLHQLDVAFDETLTVRGDPARLQQCVVNLLINAAKYTPPGGRIQVRLAREADQALIAVEDTGVGLAAPFIPVIFDLFVQSDRTLDRAQGGLGVGLSVVKRLVEMQCGTVSARSDGLGKGSTFEIRLPVALGVDAPEHADKQRAQPTSLRVLVVDDNTDAADSMAMALQTAKHDVRTVYGASQALQLAREWRPHAILLDIGLPELDGYSVARRLREDPAMDGTHLIALTGYGQPVDKARALEAGFSRHLVKPAPLADVLEALEVIGASF